MTKRQIADKITVAARNALDHIWKKVHLKGRCWGLKSKEHNSFCGTNITLGEGDEIVSVSERDGELIIHEFVRAKGTSLGSEVREVLLKNKLPVNSD